MKTIGLKHLINAIFKGIIFSLLALNLVACGDEAGGFNSNNGYGSYYPNSYEACNNQKYNAGIVGNTYCPYQGQYVNGRYQAYAAFEVSGAIYLDFGFQYNDMCPAGAVPVFENIYGQTRFKRCDRIGNDYVDNLFYSHHNTSSCNGGWAGDRNCIPGY